jgi:hypothetical protein
MIAAAVASFAVGVIAEREARDVAPRIWSRHWGLFADGRRHDRA